MEMDLLEVCERETFFIRRITMIKNDIKKKEDKLSLKLDKNEIFKRENGYPSFSITKEAGELRIEIKDLYSNLKLAQDVLINLDKQEEHYLLEN